MRRAENAVDGRQFPVQPSRRCRRDADAQAHKVPSFVVGQEALGRLCTREAPLFCPQKENVIRVTAPLGKQTSHADAVETGRDGAHGALRQGRSENAAEILRGADTGAQDTVDLLHQAG